MFLLPQDSWEMRKRVYKNSQNEKKQNRGIFAKKDIAAGTIIGDYLGLVIPEKEENTYENSNEMYLMYYTESATIYPDVQQPGIHILNHSCEPNTWMYTYKGHTLYFALRKIYKGEELTVSYQLNPIDEDCEPCDHACHCHTPSCTGSMHMTEEKYDAWRAFDDKETAKTKTVSDSQTKSFSAG
jgi:SET domain-containing protein